MPKADRLLPVLAALLPGALLIYFSFSSGGFFPGATGVAATALGVVLALRMTTVERPLAGITPWVGTAAGALAVYAVWQLLSASWSHAPARAVLEFDRTLLYLFALLLFGSMPHERRHVRWAIRGLAVAIVAVTACSVITRIAPDVWPTAAGLANNRLSYPISYWNALGVLCAIGIALCVHLASSAGEPLPWRVFGAAGLPIVCTTLLFTFSRGGIVTSAIALVLYVLIARPIGLPLAAVAAAPGSAVAVVTAYQADLLATFDPTTPAAVAQGHHVARVLLVCVAGSAVLRLVMAPLDNRLASMRSTTLVSRELRLAAAGAATAAVVAGFLVLGGPSYLSRQYDRFIQGNVVHNTGDFRNRLTDPGNNGRVELWRVGFDEFKSQPLHGSGAGTFQVLWAQNRKMDFPVVDGHSLYIETMGEMGIVGLLAIVTALLAVLIGLAVRARGRDRAMYAALLAPAIAWAAHAGVDWDWELPAITLWLWALGGVALSARPEEAVAPAAERSHRLVEIPLGRFARIVVGLGFLVLSITPALAAASQNELNKSVAAWKRGDCKTAVDKALAANNALSVRPEPFEILAFCDVRAGQYQLAVDAMRKAVDRDPDNWEFRYGLAIVRGAAGQDALGDARRARRLNPRNPLTRDLVLAYSKAKSRRQMKRRALEARLPIS